MNSTPTAAPSEQVSQKSVSVPDFSGTWLAAIGEHGNTFQVKYEWQQHGKHVKGSVDLYYDGGFVNTKGKIDANGALHGKAKFNSAPVTYDVMFDPGSGLIHGTISLTLPGNTSVSSYEFYANHS